MSCFDPTPHPRVAVVADLVARFKACPHRFHAAWEVAAVLDKCKPPPGGVRYSEVIALQNVMPMVYEVICDEGRANTPAWPLRNV